MGIASTIFLSAGIAFGATSGAFVTELALTSDVKLALAAVALGLGLGVSISMSLSR